SRGEDPAARHIRRSHPAHLRHAPWAGDQEALDRPGCRGRRRRPCGRRGLGATGSRTTPPPPNREVATRPIDVSRARIALDYLLFERLDSTTASMVRDSARRFYDAPGISATDKAYAAFVLGNAFFSLKRDSIKDRANGCEWVRTAVDLDTANTSYRRVRAQCQN